MQRQDDSATSAFERIPAAKREQVFAECTREFAEYGYTGASTNRMVERIGISKGSLFYYFGDKRQLYVAVLDRAAEEIQLAVERAAEDLPADPVERVIKVARTEYAFYSRRPELYRLFRRALADPETAQLVRERYTDSGTALFARLIGSAEFAKGVDANKAVAVLAWIVNGFNEVFRASASPDADPQELAERYETGLRQYLAVVSPCVAPRPDAG